VLALIAVPSICGAELLRSHAIGKESMADAAASNTYRNCMNPPAESSSSLSKRFPLSGGAPNARPLPLFARTHWHRTAFVPCGQWPKKSGLMNVPPTPREQLQRDDACQNGIGFLDTANRFVMSIRQQCHPSPAMPVHRPLRSDMMCPQRGRPSPANSRQSYFHDSRADPVRECPRPADPSRQHNAFARAQAASPCCLIHYARSLNAPRRAGRCRTAESARATR